MSSESVPSSALKPFPATVDFVHLSSVVFRVNVEPIFATPEERQGWVPSSWQMDFACNAAGDGRYLGKMEVTACFEEEEAVSPPAGGDADTMEVPASPPPYELAIALSVGVRISDGVPEEFMQQWLQKGVQYLVFPYVRTAISDLLGRTGFARPYFPLFAVPLLYGQPTPEDTAPPTPSDEH